MVYAANSDSIRDLVVSTAAKFGAAESALSEPDATDILRGGLPIGRRFDVDGFRAIWLADRDVIVFFARDGRMLKTVSASAALATSP